MLISATSIRATSFPSARVSAVVIGANRTVPQPAGTTIIWTATASGGGAPYQYKWLVFNGSEWEVAQNWSPSNAFTWAPAFANARYRVAVRVRCFGNTSDEFEASTEAAFAIEAASSRLPAAVVPPATPVSTVTLAPDLPSPQPAGAAVTWTAIATGGGAGRQFKWFMYDGSRWTMAASWSTCDTLLWTPTRPNRRHRISVWARSAGSTSDYFEACAEVEFAISDRRRTKSERRQSASA